MNRDNLTNHEFRGMTTGKRVIVTGDNGKHVAVSYFGAKDSGKTVMEKQIFLNQMDRGDLEFKGVKSFVIVNNLRYVKILNINN